MEETTNWASRYENDDQKEERETNRTDSNQRPLNEQNQNHLKSAEANGYLGSDDETSYKLTADDDDDDKEDDDDQDTGSSDWGTVDPQADGRRSSNDPSGPGSAV